MNIDIKKIKDRGEPERERLVLEVFRDDDIGRYVVFDTSAAEGGEVSNQVKGTYWFPDLEVAAGDLVVLYTKKGSHKVKSNEDGTRAHFFYWGLERPIWGGQDEFAVLLQARNWNAQKVSSL